MYMPSPISINFLDNPATSTPKSEPGRPDLATLSFALRHPKLWPADFSWNFLREDCCAMGLAHAMWPGLLHYGRGFEFNPLIWAQGAFGLSQRDALRLFYEPGLVFEPTHEAKDFWAFVDGGPFSLSNVAPEVIADAIDQYLVEQARKAKSDAYVSLIHIALVDPVESIALVDSNQPTEADTGYAVTRSSAPRDMAAWVRLELRAPELLRDGPRAEHVAERALRRIESLCPA